MKRIVLLLALVAAAPAQGAETTITTLNAGTPVSAWGGVVAFSQKDADGRYRLMIAEPQSGVLRAAPVAPRGAPFDVDLGPGAGGHVLAAYSRCAEEKTGQPLPNPAFAERCRLRVLDVVTGVERRVKGASAPRASEFHPAVWRNGIAFVRVFNAKPDEPQLYWRPLDDAGAKSTHVVSGPRGTCERGKCTKGGRFGVSGLDLYGKRVAYSWHYPDFAEGFAYQLRLTSVGSRRVRVVDHVGGGGLTSISIVGPAFADGKLYWARTCTGDGSGCGTRDYLARTRYAGVGAAIEKARIPYGALAHARGAQTVVEVDRRSAGYCMDETKNDAPTCEIYMSEPEYF